MRLRIEVFIDFKLEKLAPFSQPSVHASGFHGRTLEGIRVGMDATENALILLVRALRARVITVDGGGGGPAGDDRGEPSWRCDRSNNGVCS